MFKNKMHGAQFCVSTFTKSRTELLLSLRSSIYYASLHFARSYLNDVKWESHWRAKHSFHSTIPSLVKGESKDLSPLLTMESCWKQNAITSITSVEKFSRKTIYRTVRQISIIITTKALICRYQQIPKKRKSWIIYYSVLLRYNRQLLRYI